MESIHREAISELAREDIGIRTDAAVGRNWTGAKGYRGHCPLEHKALW